MRDDDVVAGEWVNRSGFAGTLNARLRSMSQGSRRRAISRAFLLAHGVIWLFFADGIAGQPGSLDPSFRAEFRPGESPDQIGECPDGSWVVRINQDSGTPTERSSVVRLRSDGARIPTFRSPEVLRGEGYIKDLAVDASGRIYLSGKIPSAQGIEYLIRLNAEDGSRDDAFPRLLGYDQQLSWILPARNGGLWVYGFMEDEARNGLQLLAPSGEPVPSFRPGKDWGGFGAFEDPGGRLWLFPPFRRLLSDGMEDHEFEPPAIIARPEDRDTSQGTLLAMALDSEGRWLLAGDFSKVGDHPTEGVARLLSNGRVDPSFQVQGCDREVGKLIFEPSGKIIACGTFSRMGGDHHFGLARLNPDGSVDRSYVADIPGHSYRQVMDRQGRMLVLQGNTQRGPPLVRLLGGELDAAPPAIARQPADANVRAGGTLALSVQFRSSESAQLQWFHNGQPIAGATQTVYQVDSARVTNSGSHTVSIRSTLGSAVSRSALVAVHPPVALAGWPDPRFDCGQGPDATVTALLAMGDHRLVIGGFFSNFSGHPASGLAVVDDTGLVDAGFLGRALPFQSVYSLVRYDDERFVVGGGSGARSGQGAGPGVVRLYLDGRSDPTFRPQLAGASVVHNVVSISGGRLLLAGDLWLAEDPRPRSVVRLLADGSLDPTFHFSTNYNLFQTRACAAPAGRFWLAGQEASSRESLILSMPEDGLGPEVLLAKWSSRTRIQCLLPGSEGSLWVGGDFDLTNRLGRRVFAALQLRPDGSLLTRDERKEEFPGLVGETLAWDAKGRLLVGTLAGAWRVRPDGRLDRSWAPRVRSVVTAFANSPAGDVYLAGPFREVNRVRRNFVARVYGDDRTEPYLLGPYLTPDGFELTLDTFEGWVYELETTDELPPNGAWTPSAAFTGSGTQMVIRDPNPSQPHRFHRVRVRLAGDPKSLE